MTTWVIGRSAPLARWATGGEVEWVFKSYDPTYNGLDSNAFKKVCQVWRRCSHALGMPKTTRRLGRILLPNLLRKYVPP